MIIIRIFKKQNRKFLTLILALFIVLQIVNMNFASYNFESIPNYENYQPFLKTSETVSPIFINGSATGVGAHNWSWVVAQPWFDGGNGSRNNPYLIEGITITGSSVSTCIEVVDSDKYFILQNCVFYYAGPNPQAGIKMNNVSNCKIMDNNIRWNDGHGINIKSSHNINITENTIAYNEVHGAMFSNIQDIIFKDNIIERNINDGLNLENGGNIILSGNYFIKNYWRGCFLSSSSNINLIYNDIIANRHEGIILQLVNESCLLENRILHNTYTGLEISGLNNLIINNSINSNTGNGIDCHWYAVPLFSTQNNTFFNNEILYNYGSGFDIEAAQFNRIFGNYINNNEIVGLSFSHGHYNNVTGNQINDNNGNWGIYLSDSENNTIMENQIIGNKGTIWKTSSPGNIIQDNIYEIPKSMFIDLSEQIFTYEAFNITFYIHDENRIGITVDSIQMWWNGTNVSSDTNYLGGGFYFISLLPIMVTPGENPILLNMTVNADGYNENYFEIDIAVDPETVKKDTEPELSPTPTIPGFYINLIILTAFSVVYVLIRKKTK